VDRRPDGNHHNVRRPAREQGLEPVRARLFVTPGQSAGPAIRLKTGLKLAREWRGETHDVLVLEDGFEWNGERRRSLSAIAQEITGIRWSGPRFFSLKPRPMPFGGEERADGYPSARTDRHALRDLHS